MVGVYGDEISELRNPILTYFYGTFLVGFGIKINYRVNEGMIANIQA
jgi:hypothetical protein